MRKIYFYLQYFLFRGAAKILNFFGRSFSIRIAQVIGALLFFRVRRRKIAIDNIHAAFPEKSDSEVKKIGRLSMQGMVKVIFEFIRIPQIARNPEKYIKVEGDKNVWQALKQKKGVVLAVSHFGNWELMGVAAGAKGLPIDAIGKPTKNPFVCRFIKALRGATGLRNIDQNGAIKKTIQLLKKNQVIAMLVDERVKGGTTRVNFFGRKTAVSSLPAMLGLKYEAPVIPTFYYREEAGRSVLYFGKPFKLIKTGDVQADLTANTQQYMSCLEEQIKKRPEDWTLWMHQRWCDQAA